MKNNLSEEVRVANYGSNQLVLKSSLAIFLDEELDWSTAAYYKPFVNRRIGEIQTLMLSQEWRFGSGAKNDGDLAERWGLNRRKPHPRRMACRTTIFKDGMAILEDIRSSG